MKIEVKCFAAAREIVDAREVALELPEGATLGEFRQKLFETYAGLRDLGLQFALNMVYVGNPAPAAEPVPDTKTGGVTWATELRDGDVVACIPPVGGG